MQGEESHFASPTKETSYEKAAEGVIPANTKASTKWAVGDQWLTQRNSKTTGDSECKIPTDVLDSHDVNTVCSACSGSS